MRRDTILPNFINLSAANGGIGRKGEKRKRASGDFFIASICFLANQSDSPGQPKRPLRAATAVSYNYYVQLVAIERNWMRVANLNVAKGGKLVVHKPRSKAIRHRSIAIIKRNKAVRSWIPPVSSPSKPNPLSSHEIS